MHVPALFFGTSGEVAGRLRKLVTSIKRGAQFEQVFPVEPLLELAQYPAHYICMSTSRLGLGGPNFRVDQFERAFFWKLDIAARNRLRDSLVEFLAPTFWGCLLLNLPQAYDLCYELPFTSDEPSRRAFVGILNSTCANWPTLRALGQRFYSGLGPRIFSDVQSLSWHVLGKCGFDSYGMDGRGLAAVCEKEQLIARLSLEDDFWEEVRSGRRGEALRLARQAKM